MEAMVQSHTKSQGPWLNAPKLAQKTMEAIKRKAKKTCSKKTLKKRIPICDWLPRYNLDDLMGDSIAGLTVGLTVMPQAIAYAFLAGLPPNYGLYSAFIGCLIYVVLGTCKEMSIGPTAIMSILTYSYADGNPDVAALLSFTTGILILIFGFFNLGFLISFVSKPVISGFVSAASITIASSQLKGLFGLKIKPHGLVDTWMKVGQNIGDTKWPDLVLGIACIVILLSLKKMRELQRFKPSKDDTFKDKALKTTVFLVSVGRNALVVITASIIAASLGDDQPFSITGEIEPGLPTVQPPPFSTNNGTTTFSEMISGIGAGIIVMPLVIVLEQVAISSAFAKGKVVDATQEMYAVGVCNIVGCFFQAYPTAGSFSRTAVNSQSGVRTTAGGTVTSVLVILALAILTPYFRFIPLASLAAVIICAVIFMIEYHDIVPIWRVRKVDELVLWVSFLVCIFWKVEFGLLCGVVINLLVLLFNSASPKVEVTPVLEDPNVPPHVIVSARMGLLYVNVDNLRGKAQKVALKIAKGIHPVVIDCYHFAVIDYSASCGMKAMCEDFDKRSQPLLFMNASPGVQRGLKALNPFVQIVDREDLVNELMRMQEEMAITVITEKEANSHSKADYDKTLVGEESVMLSTHLLNGVDKNYHETAT